MPAELKEARYELATGDVLTVRPVPGLIQRALRTHATEAYPEPDRTPFEREIPDALMPGTKTKAEDNPEWLRKMQGVLQRRGQAYLGLLLDATVTVDDRAAFVARYTDRLDMLRSVLAGQPVEASLVSEFVLVLVGVLAEDSEIGALVKLAQGATPLTEGEVSEGLRFFRSVAIQRPRRANRPKAPQSQDIQPAESSND